MFDNYSTAIPNVDSKPTFIVKEHKPWEFSANCFWVSGAYHAFIKEPEERRQNEERERKRIIMEKRLLAIANRIEALQAKTSGEEEFLRGCRPLKEVLFSIDASVLSPNALKGYQMTVDGFIENGILFSNI